MIRTGLIVLAGWLATGLVQPVWATAPRHGPKAVEVKVQVGSPAGDLIFTPNALRFQRGVYYRLLITNPSDQAHYFTSDAFATHVFTRKVEVLDAEGETMAELHGAIRDIELPAGTTVAWYFFPMTNGEGLPLYCHKKGHRESGMVGTIDIFGSIPTVSP